MSHYKEMIEIHLSLMDEDDLRTVYNFILGMERGKRISEERKKAAPVKQGDVNEI